MLKSVRESVYMIADFVDEILQRRNIIFNSKKKKTTYKSKSVF